MRLKRNKTDTKLSVDEESAGVDSFVVVPKDQTVVPSMTKNIPLYNPAPTAVPVKKPSPMKFSAMEGFAPASSNFNIVQSNAIRDIKPIEKNFLSSAPSAAEIIPVALAKKTRR
jgi:hypothetical protein